LPPNNRFRQFKVFHTPAGPTPTPHVPEPFRADPAPTTIGVGRNIETYSAATPQLTVEKRGPYYQKAGANLSYQIAVRNVGAIPAYQVRIEDEIPGMMLKNSTPPTVFAQGDRLAWVVPALRPGEEKTFLLELVPVRPGDLVSTTSVVIVTSTSFRTKQEGDIPARGPELNSAIGGNSSVPPIIPNLPPNAPNLLNPPVLPPSTAIPNPNPPLATTTPPAAPAASAAPAVNPLHVEVKSPASVLVGQKVVFEVVISNHGTTPLGAMMLYGSLPPGLSHPEGDSIGADLPALGPGETKSFKMPVTASAPGKHAVEIRVKSGKDIEVMSRPMVEVAAPGLTIQQSSAASWQMGRDNDLKIQVTNHGSTPLKQVEIHDILPDGIDYVTGSDLAKYQEATRTVLWLLDSLPAGETRTLSLRVQPRSPGQFPHEVVAKAEALPEARSSAVYKVEGFANLNIDIANRDNPLELGKETVYTVRIANKGTSVATNVQLTLVLSDGLEATSNVQAPTAPQLQGRQLVFAPLARLAPGGSTLFVVGVRSTKIGEQRVRAQVVSAEHRTPLAREEHTQVYRDR
jgi:uncharacterized repeat protein (TIGR01451 family)